MDSDNCNIIHMQHFNIFPRFGNPVSNIPYQYQCLGIKKLMLLQSMPLIKQMDQLYALFVQF